jgi:hypothetical protein
MIAQIVAKLANETNDVDPGNVQVIGSIFRRLLRHIPYQIYQMGKRGACPTTLEPFPVR